MKCKLCDKEKDLCKSHIIPKTFYASINDKIGRSVPISKEKTKLEFIQSGMKEKLLCKDCEGQFSVWENTLKKVLVDLGNQASNSLVVKKVDENLLHIENINYKEFKLGALSILWRCSVSSNDFFSKYNLGVYEEKIRKLLYIEQCPNEKEYALILYQYCLNGEFLPDMILGFPQGKYQKIFTVQKFIIFGHMFLFVVNDRLFPDMPIENCLRENGDMRLEILESTELVSRESVIARIFDEDVKRKMEDLRT